MCLLKILFGSVCSRFPTQPKRHLLDNSPPTQPKWHLLDNSLNLKYLILATDAKDRQHWINLMRAVAEYHGQSTVKPLHSPQPSKKDTTSALKRSATIATSNPHHSKSPIQKLKSSVHQQGQRSSFTATNPIKEELKNIKDALNSVNEFHSSALEALEVCFNFFFFISLVSSRSFGSMF